MRDFKYIEDVQAWLEPADYQGFWALVAPFDFPLPDRAHCDQQIASGEVEEEIVLYGLKAMVVDTLTIQHGLQYKPVTPWLTLVEG